jgi:hypothetical protein
MRGERMLWVFENRVLRRIFGPERDEASEEWRRLHNEELNDLFSSPNVFLVIKSRRMRWAGHVVLMGEKTGIYRFMEEKPAGETPLEVSVVSVRIIYKMDNQEVRWVGGLD